jgi:predicted PhzF superfamily epimerase YddE/YHI9
VRGLKPDFTALAKLDAFSVAATAKGDEADFVSRFFVPKLGIPEDPVTGSVHCSLVPFWAERLGSTRLRALQVSARGGELFCELKGDRVRIGGRAVKVLEGTFLMD